jgi:hypothetical protein
MDFLMAELQGPESSAARNIFVAPDAGSAAAAIATDFLRPAPEHLKRRVAEYTGINPGASIPAIMEIMADPYAPQGDKMVLGALLEQQLAQMQPPDPMQALEMQYKQAQIDQMRNPQTDPMRALEMEYKQAQIDQMRNPQANADVPAGYRELQLRAESSGLLPGSPEYQQFMLTGGGGIGESKPAQFEALHLQAMAAGLTEGTPEYKQFMLTKGAGDAALARTMAEAKGTQTAAASTQIANADTALKGIADLRTSDGLDWGTGASSMLTVPGTAAYGFATQVDQLKGGAFLTAIQQLQGMGALSNAEGATSTAAIARLDRAQSKEDFLKALDDYEAIVKAGRARAEARLTGGAPASANPLEMSDEDFLESLGLQ